MKLGLKTIVLALVVALLCVPAAFAKGEKGGHGHGKPSWAGQGKSHEKKAKLGKAHAKKAKHEKSKQQKAGSEDAAALDGELNLDDLNPSWYCKTLEAMMDATDADAAAGGAEAGEFSSFDAEFGENDNKRNSHGKCVSARAQGEDLSGALDSQENQEQSCDEPAEDGSEDPAADQGSEDPAAGGGSEDPVADDSTVEDGTDEPVADDPADDGSDDQAGETEECESDDSAAEDDQAGEDDQGEETEVAAFARALVRFIKL